MKLDSLFEREFEKLKKVRLKTDPKKPLLEYEGFILKEAPVPNKDPGTTLRSRAGGFLSKVGQAYQDLQATSQKFKKFGEGDFGLLKDIGIGMLEKQLDLDTNKVSVFGKKGYMLVEYTMNIDSSVSSESVEAVLNNLLNIYERRASAAPTGQSRPGTGPTGNRQTWGGLKPGQEIKRRNTPRTPKFGKIQDVPEYGPWHRLKWLVRDEKTGRFRKIDPKDVPPEFIPDPVGPSPAPGPAPAPGPSPAPAPKSPPGKTVKLLLKIIKKDNMVQAGIPYVLVPANEETKNKMKAMNLSYAKFIKHVSTQSQVENATILDNSGKIFFYNLNNQYAPEYTETVNYVYQSPYYRMGTYSPRELTIMFDPTSGYTATKP